MVIIPSSVCACVSVGFFGDWLVWEIKLQFSKLYIGERCNLISIIKSEDINCRFEMWKMHLIWKSEAGSSRSDTYVFSLVNVKVKVPLIEYKDNDRGSNLRCLAAGRGNR